MRAKVDLPEPEAPTSTTRDSAGMSNVLILCLPRWPPCGTGRAGWARRGLRPARRHLGVPRCSRAVRPRPRPSCARSEEHTSELQSRGHLVCRLLLEKKNKQHVLQRELPNYLTV